VSTSAGDPPPVRPAPLSRRDRVEAAGIQGLGTARAALIAHLLSLAGGLAVLLHYGSRQWFFTDEWEFITRNLPGPDRLGLFVPHNEHWSTIPILLYRVLFAAFGLHSYVPYILVLVVLHVTAAHLIWRLAVRTGASPWIATAVAAVFLLLGVGWEQMIAAFQIGFSLSLVCGLAWLLITDLDLPAAATVLFGWALGVAASMSSGIGIPMIGAVAVAVLARRGPRAALVAASVPTLANVAWYAAVHPRATLPSTGHQLWMLPQFVWRGLSASADGALGPPVVGSLLLVALFVWLAIRLRSVSPVAVGCASGAVFLFILVGYGRISLGVDQAAASRYLYLATALLACPAAVALSSAARQWVRAEALLVAALALSTLHGAYVLRQNIRVQHAIEASDRAVVMAAARVVSSGATLLGSQPDPLFGPDIDVSDLRNLVQTGALTPDGANDPGVLLTVESRVEMSSGPAPALTGPPPSLQVLDGASSGSGSCHVQPPAGGPSRVRVAFTRPAAFSVSADRSVDVTSVLTSASTGTAAAPSVTYHLRAGTALWISVSVPGGSLEFGAPGPVVYNGTAGC
jgi:hypothetical protein